MLVHPTLDKLESLRLAGMVKAFKEQMEMADISDMTFEERLGLLADREARSVMKNFWLNYTPTIICLTG